MWVLIGLGVPLGQILATAGCVHHGTKHYRRLDGFGGYMNIKDVSWVDVQSKLRDTNLLIVPLGATETYGPHLAMGTETYVGDYVGTELGNRLDCLVAPTIPVTCSGLLDPFPGNLYGSPSVLKGYIQAVCDRMIAWGITRIFFLNIHGPNLPVVEELSREYLKQDVRCSQIDFWRFMIGVGSDLIEGEMPYSVGHASEMATAVALAINPSLVFEDRFGRWVPNIPLAVQYPDVITYRTFKEECPEGFTGEPGRASAEQGRELLNRTITRLDQFLRDWR